MKNRKIINDPVHGFITIPFDIVFSLLEHPYFQRLRRIKQLGMTDFVYPGAVHTRFLHALGAMHLMTESLRTLLAKGVSISEDECEAACLAILLHDVGHGPFSHALEHLISEVDHEEISLLIMNRLNEEYKGRLSMAIDIFKGHYEKHFLHELVSSQLDMDRMDYLTRDSFFTGVAEGVVGYDRIIKMLDVKDDRLVVEEKALFSVQKFLLARHFMYWQVYLHKTVLSTEIMLQQFYHAVEVNHTEGNNTYYSEHLGNYIEHKKKHGFDLDLFLLLDDTELIYSIKRHINHDHPVIKVLANGLKNRELFKLVLSNQEEVSDLTERIRHKSVKTQSVDTNDSANLIFTGEESTTFYDASQEEILILRKSGDVTPLSNIAQLHDVERVTRKSYVCYPKFLDS